MPDPIKPHQPVPGKPIPTYPTPNVNDSIYIEVIDAWQGKYEVLAYGTEFNSVEHGAFPKDLPDHILVYEGLQDPSGQYRKRVWVNNRTDQDNYNWEITYNGGDPSYPDYVRTYVYKRDDYTPVAELTADPDHATAFLVSEKTMTATEPAELASQYIKVVRVYRTLPGPVSYEVSYPYGGVTSFPRVTVSFDDKSTSYAAVTPGTACTISGYTSAVLISEVAKISEEENGVISVKRVYDKIPASTDQQGFGYKVSYRDGDKDYPFIEWSFKIAISTYSAASDLSACPISGFTGLLLVDQTMDGSDDQNQIVTVVRKYETLPGPLNYTIDYDNNQLTYPIVTTKQRVSLTSYSAGTEGTTTCGISGFTTLILFEQHMNPTEYANVKEDQRIYEKTPNNIVTTNDFDPELNIVVQTTRQKIVAGATPSPSSTTIELREKPLDKFRTLQIITSFAGGLPSSKIEYKTGQWPFPALLDNINCSAKRIGDVYYYTGSVYNQRPRYEVTVTPSWLRQLQNVSALFKVTTSFHQFASLPSISITTYPTRDIFYNGISFRFEFRNVLCNAMAPNMSFSGVGDGKYGDLVESISIAATSPTATSYYNSIGTYKTIAVDQERYKGTIWVQQKTEVLLQ